MGTQKLEDQLTMRSIRESERATKLRTARAWGTGRENAQKSQAGLTGASIQAGELRGKAKISQAYGTAPNFAPLSVTKSGTLTTNTAEQKDEAKQAYSKYLASQEAT